MSATLLSPAEPVNVTFPNTVSIAATALRKTGISPPELSSDLLSTSDGARGIFVLLLADRSLSLADIDPPDPVMIESLYSTTGSNIRLLAVRNVVMSTEVVIQYGKSGQPEQAPSSELSRDRAMRIFTPWLAREDLGPTEKDACLRRVVAVMLNAIFGLGGPHDALIRTWAYDDEQKVAMNDLLLKILQCCFFT